MTRTFHLRLDRVVLDPAFGAVDRTSLAEALEAELTRRLGERGLADDVADGIVRRGLSRLPRVEGTPFEWAEGAGTERLARHLADSILRGIQP